MSVLPDEKWRRKGHMMVSRLIKARMTKMDSAQLLTHLYTDRGQKRPDDLKIFYLQKHFLEISWRRNVDQIWNNSP